MKTTVLLISPYVIIKTMKLLQNYFKTHGITVPYLSSFLLKNQIPTTLFFLHKVLIWSFKNDNSQLQWYPINHNTCRGSWKLAIMTLEGCLYPCNSNFWGKRLMQHSETKFKDKKWVFFTIFLAKHWTTSHNPIFLQFWWIWWNSKFWLGVENLKYYGK